MSSAGRALVACRKDAKGIRSFDDVDNVIVDSKASEADQEEQTQEDVEEEDWPPAKVRSGLQAHNMQSRLKTAVSQIAAWQRSIWSSSAS